MSRPKHRLSGLSQFVAELSRRHVVRFSIGYAAAAFVVLQLAEIVFPAFGIGETGLRVLVIAVVLLFPPAVVLAWLFDLTPEGIQRTREAEDDGERLTPLTPRLALLVVTVLVVGALTLWLVRGGAFQAPGTEAEAPAEVSPVLAEFNPSQPIRALAVLPLENISPTGEQDYFSAGMHEELIAQLSQLSGLRVVSRTSVMRYLGTDTPIPTIGKELQVDAVIEGSVRRDSTHVRITVQLIQASSDTHIWTKQYDRDLGDALALESEVAQEIAQEIQARVTPEQRARFTRTASSNRDPAAQRAYFQARYDFDKGTTAGYRDAMENFQEAVSRDSTFVSALAGLASTRFILAKLDSTVPGASLAIATREADRAVALDSTNDVARDVAAIIRENLDGRRLTSASDTTWVAALTQLGRRMEGQLRHPGADSARQDRIQQVLAARQLAVSGNFPQATDVLRGIVDANPASGFGWELLARTQLAAGQVDSTVATLDRWASSGGQGAPTRDEIRALKAAVKRDGAKGYWSWTLARMEKRQAEGVHVSRGELAAAYAALGRADDAFTVLREGVQQGDRSLLTLESDPVWDPIRSDPRFADILEQVRAMRFSLGRRPTTGPPGHSERRR